MENKENKKYEWVDELDLHELRLATYELIDENNKLKHALLLGNSKSSICLIKNTKGVNAEVKVYDDDAGKAKDKAVELFDDLNKRYKEE